MRIRIGVRRDRVDMTTKESIQHHLEKVQEGEPQGMPLDIQGQVEELEKASIVLLREALSEQSGTLGANG